ncbi:hemin uptake protein HemP [Pandoraea sp.]|uniref:hemin uptake protein HemP n=1 Tax=Pandoraea sp. TaxID=1883445 RepID=UPI0012007067|nr:hemin uptake protein HemP [Pandoraea sp.]TAL55553.1 MAG: hemin uptake protein HemP [Pandoraea sp.]TAM20118.1 MAG: hemin uptake protein HemP [Pandoraea sp.]
MTQVTLYQNLSRRADTPNTPVTPRRTLSVPAKKAEAEPATADGQRLLSSDHLLRGTSCVGITHNGQTYQLRATRYGKLILTK